jgi:hypothetical protein
MPVVHMAVTQIANRPDRPEEDAAKDDTTAKAVSTRPEQRIAYRTRAPARCTTRTVTLTSNPTMVPCNRACHRLDATRSAMD